MKNANIIFGIAGTLVLSGIIYYALSNKVQKNYDGVNSILFIGDSNTAANFSYADQLKKQFPGIAITKIAQNGAKTDWMRTQLTNALKNKKYSTVAILGGSNDIYATGKIDAAKQNLTAMYDAAHKAGAKVIAVTPPNKNFYELRTNAKQKLLADLVAFIKNSPGKDYFIDFYSLTNNKNFFVPGDGYLHPQAPAHKLLAEKTIKALNLKNV